MRELRIPSNLPKESIGIGKIAGIASPIGAMTRLHDTTTRRGNLFQNLIYFFFRAHIVRQ